MNRSPITRERNKKSQHIKTVRHSESSAKEEIYSYKLLTLKNKNDLKSAS